MVGWPCIYIYRLFLIEAEQQGGGEAKAKENETRDVAEDQGGGEMLDCSAIC